MLTVVLVASGCVSTSRTSTTKSAPPSLQGASAPVKPARKKEATPPLDGSTKSDGKPVVTRIETGSGRIAWVNSDLRFVVLDFALKPVPAVDRRLSVYRGVRKVGEVKVTGPAREGNIAADLVAGEALVGDEVRDEP